MALNRASRIFRASTRGQKAARLRRDLQGRQTAARLAARHTGPALSRLQASQKKHPMKCAGVAGRRVRAPGGASHSRQQTRTDRLSHNRLRLDLVASCDTDTGRPARSANRRLSLGASGHHRDTSHGGRSQASSADYLLLTRRGTGRPARSRTDGA